MKDKDVYGKALLDFYRNGELLSPLKLHSSYGDIEEMPVEVFFRDLEDFTDLELLAIAKCKGKILDIGAGVGCHSLELQKLGFDVVANEISPIACKIMEERGVKQILNKDFLRLEPSKFNTLLLMMNGVGFCETLEGFRKFLAKAAGFLHDGGQIIFDSSDISYLYDQYRIPLPNHYFGEITFQYEYESIFGKKFGWLYIDQKTLVNIAIQENWNVEIVFEDENDQFLAICKPVR